MKICRPLWAEGTFLSSQQFQQQARWEAFSNDSIAQLCIRHPWGIANVLFDRDALALFDGLEYAIFASRLKAAAQVVHFNGTCAIR